jgi:phosphohistidine phosphatase
MKTVLMMRHAKSSWDNPGLSDHDRPLNKRGKIAAPRMGHLLADLDLVPDVIVSSTAKRAKATVKGVLETCPFEGEVVYTRDLYHADVEEFLEALHALDDRVEIAMLVGHNPGMEYFLEIVCDEHERMPTAAIAQVILGVATWKEITPGIAGVMKNLWLPKELD